MNELSRFEGSWRYTRFRQSHTDSPSSSTRTKVLQNGCSPRIQPFIVKTTMFNKSIYKISAISWVIDDSLPSRINKTFSNKRKVASESNDRESCVKAKREVELEYVWGRGEPINFTTLIFGVWESSSGTTLFRLHLKLIPSRWTRTKYGYGKRPHWFWGDLTAGDPQRTMAVRSSHQRHEN